MYSNSPRKSPPAVAKLSTVSCACAETKHMMIDDVKIPLALVPSLSWQMIVFDKKTPHPKTLEASSISTLISSFGW
jgi:hypothetical protein